MGRNLKITVTSARNLRNADEDEGGESDPFVVICFDNNVSQELGRTEVAPDTANPEWNHECEVDVSSPIKDIVKETGEEPKMITFCVYDGDADASEPLGVAGINFAELVKSGKFEGELPVFQGSGYITVAVEMKKVKISSMLKENAALHIAGGVAGGAALGALGLYLFNRYEKKKQKLAEGEEDPARTGMAYGANVDDDDDEEEDKDNMKKWWEMDDEEEGDEDENKWSTVDNE